MTDMQVHAPRPQAPIAGTPFFEWRAPDGGLWSQFYSAPGGYLLRFVAVADFEVSADGLDILCHPTPEATDEATRHIGRNQVRLLAYSKQGKLVFHAGAVDLGGFGIAMVGKSGAGKSTLTASFAAHGQGFLTDDGLVLDLAPDGRGYTMLPGEPSVRLWNDSENALIDPAAPRCEPLPFVRKARLLAARATDGAARGLRFCDDPRPLGVLYFLGSGSAASVVIEPMGKAHALLELVKSSFLLDMAQAPAVAAQFHRVASLADTVPAFRLDYPRRFDALDEVRAALARHARATFGARSAAPQPARAA